MTLWIMKTLHHWFGAVFAAFFFVISVSGSWLVIDKYLFAPSISTAQERVEPPRTPAQESAAISKILESYPVEHISHIGFPLQERPYYHVKRGDGGVDYFDPQSLTVFKKTDYGPVTHFMTRVHKNLLNPWNIGHDIVIWTGLVAIFLAVTGLVIFIPSRRSFRKNRILLPKELSFKEVRRSHLSSGLIFSIFIVFFGATGWIIGEPEDARKVLSSSDEQALIMRSGDIPEIIDRVMLKLPRQKLTVLDFSKKEQEQALYLYTKKEDDFALYGNKRVKIDLDEGLVSYLSSGDNKNFASQTLNNAYSLHTGQGRSAVYKLMISILGIIVAIVSLMGLMSYILKWQMKISKVLLRRRKEKE